MRDRSRIVRVLAVTMAGIIGAGVPGAAAATQGQITEFSAGITGAPWAITAGPDGNLWFTETHGNRIGRITPKGTVTELSAGITAAANEITVGPDANLWFTEQFANRVGRITPAGVVTEFPVGTLSEILGGITAGPDGNLWFTEADGHRIGRIGAGPSMKSRGRHGPRLPASCPRRRIRHRSR